MTIYSRRFTITFSTRGTESFVGFENFRYFLTTPRSWVAANTLVVVAPFSGLRSCSGVPVALLLDQPGVRPHIVRLMVIAPFFVMPTVSARIWKNP